MPRPPRGSCRLRSLPRTKNRFSAGPLRAPLTATRTLSRAAGIHEASPVPDEKLGVQELFLAAQADEKEGRQVDAARRYKETLDRDPKYIPALLQMAFKAYRAADFASARDYAAKAISVNATDPQVSYTSGVIARAAGKWTLAEDHLLGLHPVWRLARARLRTAWRNRHPPERLRQGPGTAPQVSQL